jgi:hypothetical protein
MPKADRVHSTPRKNTSARPAALSERDCPILPIMRKQRALREAHGRLDTADNSNADEMNELWNARDTLLDLVSITRARSLQGALFQLALLVETLHVDLLQNLDRKVQDEVLTTEQKCVRLIQSAASVIEQIVGAEAAAEAKGVWLNDDNLGKIERITDGTAQRNAA